MKIRLVLACTAASLLPFLAQAQQLQPGLWEINSKNMQVNGQQLPDLQLLMGSLPPEQRKMAEQAMAKQGVAMAGNGVRMCITPQQAQTNDIPLQGNQAGCSQRITERTPNMIKFTVSCPQGNGQGQTNFLSAREFVTTVNGTFVAGGQPQQGRMESQGRWLAADCSSLPPRQQ